MAIGGGAKGRLGDYINDLSTQKSSAVTKAVAVLILAAVFLIGGSIATLGVLGKAAATAGVMGIPTAWGLLVASPIFIGIGVVFLREAKQLGRSLAAAQAQYGSDGGKSGRVRVDVGKPTSTKQVTATPAKPATSAVVAQIRPDKDGGVRVTRQPPQRPPR